MATTFPTYLIKLKRLQNKALRIITKTSSNDRISQHYCRLQTLKLDDLYKFEVAELMHQFTHKKISDIFRQYFTYSNDNFKYAMIIYIFLNFPPTGHNDLSNMYLLKYGTTSAVVLNKFPTLNLHFFLSTIPFRKVLPTFTYVKSILPFFSYNDYVMIYNSVY